MKLLIANDMEGVAGVVDWSHVTTNHNEYQRFRKLLTAEVNAAVEGACEAGVKEIVVADGHSGGKNVLIEELDSRASINTGSPSIYAMVTGVDQQVDAAIFIGYHARAGTRDAILAHTWSKSTVFNLWLNGRLCGEIGLNASLCGHFGVPVIFLSGDQAACVEAAEWIGPEIRTVSVKKAGAFQAAECLPVLSAREQIKTGIQEAVQKFLGGTGPKPMHCPPQVNMAVELMQPAMADAASLVPGITRIDGRKVEFISSDLPAAQHTFRTVVQMAVSTLD